MDTPLLATKLHIPPARPDLVPRPRLLQRLDAGLQPGHRLTLVAALVAAVVVLVRRICSCPVSFCQGRAECERRRLIYR